MNALLFAPTLKWPRSLVSLCLGISLLMGCGSGGGESPQALVPTQTAGSTNGAGFSPRQGLLVVSQNGNLLRLDHSGQNPVTLTSGFEDVHPAFRPDGTDLIFSRSSVDGSGQVDIFRIRPDGGGLTNLTPTFGMDALDPEYSYDGRKIAFSARISPTEQDLYLMNADGSGLTRITQRDVDRRPALSPDGKALVFERGTRICKVASTGGVVSNLTDGSQVDTNPSYCPPGEVIVFSRNDELWALDNGILKQITHSPNEAEFQAHHSREHDVIFALASDIGKSPKAAEERFKTQPDKGDIYRMNPDGSNPQQLTQDLGASSMSVGPRPNKWTANAPYPHDFSPFSHAVGVCYGHFQGRTGTVSQDMDTITKTDGFKMLHIYNLFADSSLHLDPDMKAVVDYAAAQSPKLEILLGTQNDLVSGLFQTQAGATQYVQALKPYLDTGVIKVLALGNEPNDAGQANLDPTVWAKAAHNVRAALIAEGYPDLPISACLVFGGVTSYPPSQAVFQDQKNGQNNITYYSMLGYIQAIQSINSRPFVFVNILPSFTVNAVVVQVPQTASWYPDFGIFQSTTDPASHDGNVAPYWNVADLQYNVVRVALAAANASSVQVYMSESGWPSGLAGTYATLANEVAYINNLLNLWILPQINSGGSVPVFLFEAFDEPNQGGNSKFGLRDDQGLLKPGIVLPSFIPQ